MRAALDRWMRGRLVLDLWILRWPRISAETKKRPERSHTADPVRGSVGRLAQDVSCLRASWPPPSPPATFSPPSTPHLSLSAPPPPFSLSEGEALLSFVDDAQGVTGYASVHRVQPPAPGGTGRTGGEATAALTDAKRQSARRSARPYVRLPASSMVSRYSDAIRPVGPRAWPQSGGVPSRKTSHTPNAPRRTRAQTENAAQGPHDGRATARPCPPPADGRRRHSSCSLGCAAAQYLGLSPLAWRISLTSACCPPHPHPPQA